MRYLLFIVTVFLLLGRTAVRADISADLKSFTGKHTRMVWSESTGDGKDPFCKLARHKLVGLDTDDGKGIRTIRGTLDSYSKPLITPNGDRVVFSSYITGKVYIINWDGTGLRELVTGFCSDVWADPNTGTEYVYVRTIISSTSAPIVRYAIDNISSTLTIWNKTDVGAADYGSWFQVSADGTRAAGTFPWSNAGVAYLPNSSWIKLDSGCWTSMAPDNSYDMWVFNGDHRTVSVYGANTAHKGELDLHTAPGIYGWEIYHPKWTSSPDFITMNGPYDANLGGSCTSNDCGNLITQGGTRMNMYIGKLDAARTSVTGWLRVTNNSVPEFFGDAWIEPEAPDPSAYHKKINFGSTAVSGWEQGDAYTTGGADYSGSYSVVTAGVTNAAPEALYQACERSGFDFDMSVPNGEYTVRLHITEPYYSTLAEAAANRAIDIKLENVLVEDDLDPAAAAGAVKKAAVIDHTVTVSDGNLTMNVIQDATGDDAFLMGLEVIGNASTAINDRGSTISGIGMIDKNRLYSLQGSPVFPDAAPAGVYLKRDGNKLIKVMIVK